MIFTSVFYLVLWDTVVIQNVYLYNYLCFRWAYTVPDTVAHKGYKSGYKLGMVTHSCIPSMLGAVWAQIDWPCLKNTKLGTVACYQHPWVGVGQATK